MSGAVEEEDGVVEGAGDAGVGIRGGGVIAADGFHGGSIDRGGLMCEVKGFVWPGGGALIEGRRSGRGLG